MKKLCQTTLILLLSMCLASCAKGTQKHNIHSKIHDMYYDMGSYYASCRITTFNGGNEISYDCDVGYDSKNESFQLTSADMRLIVTNEKTVITKGENSIETPSLPGDMYIFINSFFKSYYECEDTCVSVASNDEAKTILLECSAINPTQYIASMKLWLDSQSAMPLKMQLFDKNNSLNTEIIFNEFTFRL